MAEEQQRRSSAEGRASHHSGLQDRKAAAENVAAAPPPVPVRSEAACQPLCGSVHGRLLLRRELQGRVVHNSQVAALGQGRWGGSRGKGLWACALLHMQPVPRTPTSVQSIVLSPRHCEIRISCRNTLRPSPDAPALPTHPSQAIHMHPHTSHPHANNRHALTEAYSNSLSSCRNTVSGVQVRAPSLRAAISSGRLRERGAQGGGRGGAGHMIIII